MHKRSWMTLVLLVVTVLCLAGWTSRANNSARVNWEYKVLSAYGPSATNPGPNTTLLDNEGMQGWELIAIRAGEFPDKDSKQVRTDYYFKRIK